MSEASGRARFARNAIWNWTAFLFVALVGFFLSPFIVRHLGGTAYGVWSLLVALVGYLGLLDFGVRGAVTRYVAHHHAVDDHAGNASIVTAALSLYGLLGLLAVLASGVFAWLAPLFFNIPPELADDARIALVLGGLTVASTLVGAVFAGVVTGLERFDISSGVEIAMTTVRTIAVVIALDAGFGLVALGVIHLAVSILQGAVAWVNVKRIYPALRITFRDRLMPHVKTIVSFSAFLSLIHVLGLLIYYSNALIIAAFLPIAAVTYFAIAGNLVEYAFKVAGALSKMMTPRISALNSSGSKNVVAAVLDASRVATLATAPIAATFLLRGESFVDLWMGPEYGPVAGEILAVLSLVVMLGGARGIAISSIIGMNRHRTLIPWLALEAVGNLALSIALVRPMGVLGVAIGTLIPNALASLAFVPMVLGRATGVPAGEFIRSAWVKPALACLPFALGSALVERYLPAGNLAIFFLQVGVLLTLVPLGAWLFCLAPNEKRYLAAAAAGRLQRARAAFPRGLRSMLEPVEEYAMVVLFYFVIPPLVRLLPREFSKKVFGGIASLLSRATFRARDMTSSYMSAYGIDAAAARAIARRKIFWQIWEYEVRIHGVKHPDWYLSTSCEQVNREALEKVLASGSSFIVALGHFVRDDSIAWALSRSTLPINVTQLLGPIPPLRLSRPRQMYNRVHLNAMKSILGVLHGGDIDIALVGEESASATRLIRKLKTSRVAMAIYVDAPWSAAKHRSALTRGFAGAASAPFAVGAARMARATGCPILLCIPEYVDETHCRLVWHEPIWVAHDGGHDADVAATNTLLDAIEQAIGRRPERYVMLMGEGRRWNSVTERWEGPSSA